MSNLPYNVATPIVMRLLEDAPRAGSILVMVQREVGERLAAGPGTKAYGAVSVKVAYFASARVVGIVPPSVFIPAPRVESALVQLVRHPRPPVEVPSPARLFALVRAGFGQRRKMLRGALRTELGERTEAELRRRRDRPARPGGDAHARGLGPTRPGSGVSRVSGWSVTVSAPAKLTLTLRVLGTPSGRVPRARGAHRHGVRARRPL